MPRRANIAQLDKTAGAALSKQLQETLNAVPAHTWYAQPSGALVFVNERAADYGGLPKDHPLRSGIDVGASWDSHIPFLHPDDHEEARRNWSERLKTETAGEVTYRIRNASGEYRWFIGRVEPLRGSAGRLLYWVGINVDIEERMQAAKQLRAGEEQLRQILDLTPQNIAVLGPRSERLYLNRTALEYHGITPDEWRARKRGSEVHPDDQGPFQYEWDRALSEGSGFEIEVRLRKSDGTYRWFLARHNLVRDSDGQVLRWHVGCTDIEDRKRHEERLQLENAALRAEISQSSMFDEIVGSSARLRAVLAAVDKVAPTDSTILILGETGTGKELIARAIHRRSRRMGRPFIGVNCGAIPASLVASELFGHEKGSFTGATQRRLGRFEAANGGTIFLDEVGDLPPDVQIALLRVLQEREIERVGGDKRIPVDVRVLAATHHDLETLVSEGKFRQDLFYRLNVVPITMPPLRERATDIPVLAEYFIARIGKRVGKKFRTIRKGTMEILQAYSWPGNVRELQNVIERAITLSDSDTFAVDEAWLQRRPVDGHQPGAPLSGALLAHEKEAIEAALAESRGRLSGPTGAAEKLRIPVSTLDSKIKRLGIDKYRFMSR
ncbi:MAG TPA: sigma 54-interacting transcriptional regulator [Rhizomicrobium sp.]|nr:sigma 54-interacting transcriptional regulator [Rhizomicrobium sp.]